MRGWLHLASRGLLILSPFNSFLVRPSSAYKSSRMALFSNSLSIQMISLPLGGSPQSSMEPTLSKPSPVPSSNPSPTPFLPKAAISSKSLPPPSGVAATT